MAKEKNWPNSTMKMPSIGQNCGPDASAVVPEDSILFNSSKLLNEADRVFFYFGVLFFPSLALFGSHISVCE